MKERIVVGIVTKGNKVLLIKRKNKEGNLLWSFPGGKINSNETEKSAIKREIKEETNIICKPIKKLGKRIHPDTKKEIHYWACTYEKGTIKPNREVTKACWLTSKEAFKRITTDVYRPIRNYLIRMSLCNSMLYLVSYPFCIFFS